MRWFGVLMVTAAVGLATGCGFAARHLAEAGAEAAWHSERQNLKDWAKHQAREGLREAGRESARETGRQGGYQLAAEAGNGEGELGEPGVRPPGGPQFDNNGDPHDLYYGWRTLCALLPPATQTSKKELAAKFDQLWALVAPALDPGLRGTPQFFVGESPVGNPAALRWKFASSPVRWLMFRTILLHWSPDKPWVNLEGKTFNYRDELALQVAFEDEVLQYGLGHFFAGPNRGQYQRLLNSYSQTGQRGVLWLLRAAGTDPSQKNLAAAVGVLKTSLTEMELGRVNFLRRPVWVDLEDLTSPKGLNP